MYQINIFMFCFYAHSETGIRCKAKKPLLCLKKCVCVSGFFFREKFKHTIYRLEKPVVVNMTLKYFDVRLMGRRFLVERELRNFLQGIRYRNIESKAVHIKWVTCLLMICAWYQYKILQVLYNLRRICNLTFK